MLLTENAITVLRERYLWAKPKGQLEEPHQMFLRVARHVANGSKPLEKRFLAAMEELAFLPNSPTLMNAGKKNAQLAACFVLPVPDDLRGIMDTLKWTALIHQSGGGTGFNFSRLRAARSPVGSSHGVAAGPLGFLSLFNELTQTIKQGGLRRGANMGVLSASHPDIEAFINCKNDTTKITNFNISVSVQDSFFKALKESPDTWSLVDPRTGKVVKKISAKGLFHRLCEAAWKTGEPGLIFIDEINRKNPTPSAGAIEATNPCGEQPLLPFEACNLGSINLNAIVQSERINWNRLSELVETGVIFLDRVIDTCTYPDPRIEKICRAHRKIGLGVMGFADVLLKLKIPYGSPASIKLGGQIMEFIRIQAMAASQQLAKKAGPFDAYSKSIWKKMGVRPLRNATLTTVAPTGTISLLANASAGIEPIFSYCYERHVLDQKVLWEIHPEFDRLIKNSGFPRDQIIKQAATEGTLKNTALPSSVKEIFLTTKDLSPEDHIHVQAEFQKHSDSAVSKTINFSSTATVADVEHAYLLAFKLKCKGITIYRDGSRPQQVLQLQNCPDCARV